MQKSDNHIHFLIIICRFVLLLGFSCRPVCLTPRHQLVFLPNVVVDSSADNNVECIFEGNFDHKNDTRDYFIQQVHPKAKAIDIKSIQGSIAKSKKIFEQQQEGNGRSVYNGAVCSIMSYYDEDGIFKRDTTTLQYEPETHFVAICNGTKNNDKVWSKSPERDQIIGVVSAQLRSKSPLIAGSSNKTTLPSVPLPSPHVWISNMRVHDRVRRKGVGTALLSSVKTYAKNCIEHTTEKITLVLSVDYDNVGARIFYEKLGFEYLERNSVFCIMTMLPSCDAALPMQSPSLPCTETFPYKN